MRGWWGEASSSMDTAHSQRTKSTTGQTQQHTRGRVSTGQAVTTGGSAVVAGEPNTYLSHFHPAWWPKCHTSHLWVVTGEWEAGYRAEIHRWTGKAARSGQRHPTRKRRWCHQVDSVSWSIRVLAGALQRGTISVDRDAERQVKHVLPLLLVAFLYK